MFRIRGLWNRKHRRFAGEERQRDLARRCAVRVGNCPEHLARLALCLRKIVMAKRRIGDHRDLVLLAPRDHRVLEGALFQMIEHLLQAIWPSPTTSSNSSRSSVSKLLTPQER